MHACVRACVCECVCAIVHINLLKTIFQLQIFRLWRTQVGKSIHQLNTYHTTSRLSATKNSCIHNSHVTYKAIVNSRYNPWLSDPRCVLVDFYCWVKFCWIRCSHLSLVCYILIIWEHTCLTTEHTVWKHDTIHKTANIWHIAMPSEQEWATASGNVNTMQTPSEWHRWTDRSIALRRHQGIINEQMSR